MKDEDQTKEQLIKELMELRQRITELDELVIERIQAKEALRKSENLLSSIMDQSPVSTWISDAKGTLIWQNAACRKLFGIESDEQTVGLYNLFSDKLIKEQGHLDTIRKVYEEGELVNFIISYDASTLNHVNVPGATQKLLDVTIFPIKDEGGKLVNGVIQHRDITELKRAEEKLKEYSEKLEVMVEERTKELRDIHEEIETILDNVPGLIFYKDTQNNFIRVNKVLAEGSNMTKEEMAGKSLFEIYPHNQAQAYWNDDLEVIKSGKPKLHFEEPWETSEGQRWLSTSKMPLSNEQGNIIGIIGFSTDITKRKKAEEALKEYSEKLEETLEELRETQEELISKHKLAIIGQLTGGVGHDLRNPLGAIKNAVYFLKMVIEDPKPELKETLEILEKEVTTSEKIINSLLDFARPKLPSRRNVKVNEVIQEAISKISVPENIKIVRQLEKTFPTILADPDQLDRVFGNIILNAIQAMPEGGQLTVKSEALSQEWGAISFSDTGNGIPEENMGKLFEPLFTTKAKGIGLGLAISKSFVEANGGTIEVQSEIDKGTTFTIKLPSDKIEGKVVL